MHAIATIKRKPVIIHNKLMTNPGIPVYPTDCNHHNIALAIKSSDMRM